ncbi:hypothetical protein AVEN_91105-1 [Araneus ventricosus]|uniref:Uncharacterized protein n=1 Tax=Araneus ventricosus TaxID=182803 RepID=A0A4Y2JDN9_ARAVE|nr:hypothetical protein AVEN_91105-1 [Araneus ventricosus]
MYNQSFGRTVVNPYYHVQRIRTRDGDGRMNLRRINENFIFSIRIGTGSETTLFRSCVGQGKTCFIITTNRDCDEDRQYNEALHRIMRTLSLQRRSGL